MEQYKKVIMKRTFILFIVILSAFTSKSQEINNFVSKGHTVIYPMFSRSKLPKVYRVGAVLGYIPVNRLEIKTGMTYTFGELEYLTFDIGARYYLLKTKFTIFPELNYYPIYNFTDKNFRQYYDIGLGVGYYGILKRIGLDFMFIYQMGKINILRPHIKLKILLGKIEE